MLADATPADKAAGERPRKRRWLCRIKTARRKGAGRYACPICQGMDLVDERHDWCTECTRSYGQFREAWRSCGPAKRCPDPLRAKLLARYCRRAELQLDLFEPPSIVPVRD